jgi:purine-nucleoside phosphorylase
VSVLAEIGEAVGAIQARSPVRPSVGLVLGSGLGGFAQTLDKPVVIPYGEIKHFPTATAIGHKGELVLGHSNAVPVAVMSGRVHYYEGYRPDQVVFPVRVLARLGVKVLVLTNAAGSVNVNYKPGELMVISDHINLMGMNPLVGPNEERLGLRFFDMSDAYDPALRDIAEKACWKAGVTVRHGVYVAVAGPSYETPAEIRAFRTLGADAVGMSTVPEVIAARHMGVRVLAISCITNLAAGVSKKKLDHLEVLEVGRKAQAALSDVLARIIQEAAKQA